MKGKNLIFTGLIAAIVGIVLIIFRNSLATGEVVKAGGILFLVAGVLNVTLFLGSRNRHGEARLGTFGTAFSWIVSAAAVVLGLAMLMFSGAFVAITGFMFAVLILFCSLFQMFLLFFGTRPVRLSNWFFLVPMVLVGAAVFVFLRRPDEIGEHVVMIVSGCSFLVFGLATLVEGIAVGQSNRNRVREAQHTAAEVTEVKHTEAVQEKTESHTDKPETHSDKAE